MNQDFYTKPIYATIKDQDAWMFFIIDQTETSVTVKGSFDFDPEVETIRTVPIDQVVEWFTAADLSSEETSSTYKEALQEMTDSILSTIHYSLQRDGSPGDTLKDFLNLSLITALDTAKDLGIKFKYELDSKYDQEQ